MPHHRWPRGIIHNGRFDSLATAEIYRDFYAKKVSPTTWIEKAVWEPLPETAKGATNDHNG